MVSLLCEVSVHKVPHQEPQQATRDFRVAVHEGGKGLHFHDDKKHGLGEAAQGIFGPGHQENVGEFRHRLAKTLPYFSAV